MKEKKHGNWEKIVSGIKKHALSREPGIDGILVTVGLCIIALLLCVVMKDSLTTFIQTIVQKRQIFSPVYKAGECMTGRKKEAGNVGEILTIGLCILALTALMISYMENVQLIAKKAEVGQLARCYLLKMETVGYLAAQDQTQLTAELENLGMTGIDYEGSTLNPAGYGNDVVLQIHGRLGETYEIYEKRVSTAKN